MLSFVSVCIPALLRIFSLQPALKKLLSAWSLEYIAIGNWTGQPQAGDLPSINRPSRILCGGCCIYACMWFYFPSLVVPHVMLTCVWCVCYCMFVVLGAGVVALVLASWAAASQSVVWTVSGEHVTPVTSLPIVSTLQQTTQSKPFQMRTFFTKY